MNLDFIFFFFSSFSSHSPKISPAAHNQLCHTLTLSQLTATVTHTTILKVLRIGFRDRVYYTSLFIYIAKMYKHFCLLMEQVSQIGKSKLLVQKFFLSTKLSPHPPSLILIHLLLYTAIYVNFIIQHEFSKPSNYFRLE